MCCTEGGCVCRAQEDEFVEPCLKYILTLFNFIFMSVGFAYVVIGSYLLYERDRLLAETGFTGMNEITRDLGVAFLILGIPIVVFTIFGIVATLREHLAVLKAYMAFLIIILILGVMIAVIFFIFSGNIKKYVSEKLQDEYIVNYFEDSDAKTVLDTLQIKYACCGIDGYNDWSANIYFNCNTTRSAYKCLVPFSCCKDATLDTNKFCSGDILSPEPTQLGSVNTKGCSPALTQLEQYVLYAVAGVLVGVTIILIVGIVLVSLLVKEVEEDIKDFNNQHNKKRENEKEFFSITE